LDPNQIIVRDRQRIAPTELDEGFVRSVNRRLIHPIVVRRENGEDSPVLVAGGMRLAALIKGGTTELTEGTHFRYMDDLDPIEAQIIELEENVKRLDLPWREHVKAVGRIHDLYSAEGVDWGPLKTAAELNISRDRLNVILMVRRNLDLPSLKDAGSILQAHSILQTISERRAASIVNEITSIGSAIFGNGVTNGESSDSSLDESTIVGPSNVSIEHTTGTQDTTPSRPTNVSPIPTGHNPPPIICTDFLKWIQTYSGPKFTLIHCDFPFGIGVFQGTGMKPNAAGVGEDNSYEDEPDSEVFWTLLDCLCDNIDKIASYSSHLMLWFSMNHYERTRLRLEQANFLVLNHPLVWHKTDNAGMVPGRGNHPRRTYETAFLASRGQRPLSKKLANAYGAPMTAGAIHPSQKSESMLRHFLSMLVDETTDVLDPTCGSGAALRAAEDLGARSILGLELSPTYAESALATTMTARNLRKVAR
jgi:hypothetical protein